MEITISLPNNSLASTYKELKANLKQFELAIHHAQKSVESAEQSGVELTENAFICFEHPALKASIELEKSSELKNFMDNFYEELQSVEIRLNLE